MNIHDYEKELRKKYPDLAAKLEQDLSLGIADNVFKVRAKAGVTQAELARRVGTKQTSISRLESGSTLPSLSFLKRIAEALGTYLLPPTFASNAEQLTVTSLDTSPYFEMGVKEITHNVKDTTKTISTTQSKHITLTNI